MVWVVEGTLNSQPTSANATESFPTPSKHYLRPNRLYRVGRAGGVRAPPKPGQPGPGPATRPRPYDFRIAHLAVPKEGLVSFDTGGADHWDPAAEDDGEPYPLDVVLGNKKLSLSRADGHHVDLDPEQRCQVRDGDTLREKNKGFWFTFTWVPVNLCFAAASAEKKKQHAAEAKKLGIKVSYKDVRAHHTHLVTKSAAPNISVTHAAMLQAHIVAPTFWDDLVAASAPNAFPDPARIPVRPALPLATGAGVGAGADDAEARAAHDRATARWERDLVALEADVGADSARWWGHALLERDFVAAWPDERAHVPAAWGEQDPERWAVPRIERKSLFEGVLVVSLRGNADADSAHSNLVTLGGGAFFPCPLLQHSPLPSSVVPLLDAIDAFKAAEGLAASESRVALLPPEGVLDADAADGDETDEVVLRQRELVEELQRALKVPKLCYPDGRDLATAIYELSPAALFEGGAGVPGGASDAEPGPSTLRPTQTTTQALTQATPPFPTGGVPGTHPDSGVPAPTASASGSSAAAATAAAGAEASQEGAESATSQPRKLTRRARTGRTVLDSMFDDLPNDEPPRASTSAALPSGTLDTGSLGSTAMDVDSASAPPRTQGERMPRRRVGRSAVDLLLGNETLDARSIERDLPGGDEESAGPSTTTQSMHEELMRTKKTRQERLRAIEEEDERLARIEETQRREEGRAGKVAVVAGKKRRAVSPSASASGGEGGSRKRGARKGGDAPLSTTRKRTRAQSREPTAGPAVGTSSDEDDLGARRAARKKSKAPRSPSPAAPAPTSTAAPRNKKEAAAQKKADKAAREAEAQRLLQLKPTKRRGAEADNQFTEEFNALKIVRPQLKPMPPREHRRVGWDEEDSDAERERLIVEDHERMDADGDSDGDDDMDPDHWRRPTQAMFVLRTLDVERKERVQPRAAAAAGAETDPRWAGRPNFKKFRPKNSKAPRVALAQRPQVELTVPDVADFGLGPGYNDRKGTSFSQVQQADDEDDEDEMLAEMTTTKGQTKLTFGKKPAATASKTKVKASAKSAAKGKGKGKQVVVDSEEEDDDDDSGSGSRSRSRTVHDGFDELDYSDDDAPSQRSGAGGRKVTGAAVSSSSKRATTATSRKPVQTIMIDDSDSDDSDSGLTFKGFGKKGATATGRTRR